MRLVEAVEQNFERGQFSVSISTYSVLEGEEEAIDEQENGTVRCICGTRQVNLLFYHCVTANIPHTIALWIPVFS
jgi:hypothetical protein